MPYISRQCTFMKLKKQDAKVNVADQTCLYLVAHEEWILHDSAILNCIPTYEYYTHQGSPDSGSRIHEPVFNLHSTKQGVKQKHSALFPNRKGSRNPRNLECSASGCAYIRLPPFSDDKPGRYMCLANPWCLGGGVPAGSPASERSHTAAAVSLLGPRRLPGTKSGQKENRNRGIITYAAGVKEVCRCEGSMEQV